MPRASLVQQLNRLASDRWSRRGLRIILRSAIIALALWCIGLALNIWLGWPLPTMWLRILSLLVVGVGMVFLLRPRLTAWQAARRLDQRFHLDEQLYSALEVAQRKHDADSIDARLIEQSEQTVRLVGKHIAQRQTLPWNDIVTLLLMIPLTIGLFLISGLSSFNLNASPEPLPSLLAPDSPDTPASYQPPADPAQADPEAEESAENQTQQGQADPQILQALADALRDLGTTRSVTDALDRGDVPGAAQELRELADQIAQVSPRARGELADALREAAEEISDINDAFAQQAQRTAQNLERNDATAAQGLDDLARALEELQNAQPNQAASGGESEPQTGEGQNEGQGEQPSEEQAGQGQNEGSGNGGGEGGQGSGQTEENQNTGRLNLPSKPLELESEQDEPGDVRAESSEQMSSGTEVVGSTGRPSSRPGGDTVEAEPDPLRVPYDERHVVQDYFQN